MFLEEFASFALAFKSILIEGAPFILIGTIFSGFIGVYLPSGTIERYLPKNKTLAIFVAGLLGLILPVCECAVVPVIRRLVSKGLPLSCAFAYMLAAPIVNPITIFSTWNAFPDFESWPHRTEFFTFSRIFVGYVSAVVVSLIVLRIPLEKVLLPKILKSNEKSTSKPATSCCNHTHEHAHDCDHSGHEHKHGAHDHEDCCSHDSHDDHDHKDCCSHDSHDDHDHKDCCSHDSHDNHDHKDCCSHDSHDHDHGPQSRLILAMRSALNDFTDVAIYFSIGVLITALFNIRADEAWLANLAKGPIGEVAAFMGLSFLLSLCSTSDAFIAATIAPPTSLRNAARLGFMVFGPMMDVKLIFLYATILRPKFIACLAVGLFLFVGTACLIWTPLLAP